MLDISSKRSLLQDIIFNPAYNMQTECPLLWQAFKKLSAGSKIAVVGNGPVKKDCRRLVEECNLIIRCNNYLEDTCAELVGRRCELHFMCLHGWIFKERGLAPLEAWGRQAGTSFALENSECADAMYTELEQKKSPIVLLSASFREKLFRVDCTRGFYALAFALQAKRLLNLSPVRVVGFGGPGHHYNPDHPIYHNVRAEHAIFKEIWEEGAQAEHLEYERFQGVDP